MYAAEPRAIPALSPALLLCTIACVAIPPLTTNALPKVSVGSIAADRNVSPAMLSSRFRASCNTDFTRARQMSMTVAGLWRYPVKSLAGEAISLAELTADGIPGDRVVHVRGPEGRRTSRRHYKLLGLQGTLDAAGRALIDGRAWDDAQALALVRQAAGDDAVVVASDNDERFDVLPLPGFAPFA